VDVEHLYRTYGPMVLRRCRSMLRDEHLALDAMQEVFVKVLRYRDRLEQTYPSALLYRIATNVCLNLLRGRSHRAEDGDERLALIAETEDVEGTSMLRCLIEKLFRGEPASTKAMAVMLWLDGMTLEEVAAESGLSVSGVRKRMRTFKEKIAAQGGRDECFPI